MDLEALDKKIAEVREQFGKEAGSLSADQLKAKYTGRNGALRGLFADLKSLPKDQKGAAGQHLNAAKKELEQAIAEASSGAPKVAAPTAGVDLTLPGRAPELDPPAPSV